MAHDDLRFVSLVVSGHETSAVQAIANTLDELAPDDVEVGPSHNVGHLPTFDQACSAIPPDVAVVTSSVLRADAVIIVATAVTEPVPDPLENAFAWLGNDPSRPLAGKSTAIQTASTGPAASARGRDALRRRLHALDAVVLDEPEVGIADAHRKIDVAAGCLRDHEARRLIGSQLAALACLVRRRWDQGSGSG